MPMQIVVRPDGVLTGIYNDAFDYSTFGRPRIRRASHVEPDESGQWSADLSPVNGPTFGPFDKRSEAIDAEMNFLNMMLNECEPLDETF